MKKRPIWLIISLFTMGFALSYLIAQTVGIQEIFRTFANATWYSVLGFVMASTALALLLAYKWRVVIKAEGFDIPFRKVLSYRMIGYAISYLTPAAKIGGEPVRAFLLTKHGIRMNKALSSAVIDKAVELLVHVMVFSTGVIVIINTLKMEWRAKLIIGLLTMVVIFFTFLLGAYLIDDRHKIFRRLFRVLNLHRIRRLRKVEHSLVEIEEHVERFYHNKRKVFYKLLFLNATTWILMYFEYLFGLMMLGHIANVKQIFVMLTGVGIAYSLPIPAAFGVLELSQLGAASVLGLTSALAIAFALLIRARDLIWTGIGCLCFLWNQLAGMKRPKQPEKV